jgi:hypothetical protein
MTSQKKFNVVIFCDFLLRFCVTNNEYCGYKGEQKMLPLDDLVMRIYWYFSKPEEIEFSRDLMFRCRYSEKYRAIH